jgi:hypothetical protein
MLDRESKREKILEGKLREIKIKLKKQYDLQDAKVSDLLQLQAIMPPEEKVQDDLPKIKPELVQSKKDLIFFYFKRNLLSCSLAVLIESADKDFFAMINEETQRRIKDLEHDGIDKPRKSPKGHKHKPSSSSDVHHDDQSTEAEPDTEITSEQNGNHENENGHDVNGHDAITNDIKRDDDDNNN